MSKHLARGKDGDGDDGQFSDIDINSAQETEQLLPGAGRQMDKETSSYSPLERSKYFPIPANLERTYLVVQGVGERIVGHGHHSLTNANASPDYALPQQQRHGHRPAPAIIDLTLDSDDDNGEDGDTRGMHINENNGNTGTDGNNGIEVGRKGQSRSLGLKSSHCLGADSNSNSNPNSSSSSSLVRVQDTSKMTFHAGISAALGLRSRSMAVIPAGPYGNPNPPTTTANPNHDYFHHGLAHVHAPIQFQVHVQVMNNNLIQPHPSNIPQNNSPRGHHPPIHPPTPSRIFIGINDQVRNRCDIVQPLHPGKARIVKAYDPNTIAGHVLKILGQNPDQPGALNHHLWGLRSEFPVVDDNSDLDTLRWDIIQCVSGEAMPPALPYEDQSHGSNPRDIPVRPPTVPTRTGSHLGSSAVGGTHQNGLERPGTGGNSPQYRNSIPPLPTYPPVSGQYYPSSHNEGVYGQSLYQRPPPLSSSHFSNHISQLPKKTYITPYASTPPPVNHHNSAPNQPAPIRPPAYSHAQSALNAGGLPRSNLSLPDHTNINVSLRPSIEGTKINNHASSTQPSEALGKPIHNTSLLHQSVISGRLHQDVSTPERSSSPARRMKLPKSSPSVTSADSGKKRPFRFNPAQRLVLDKAATLNMRPSTAEKSRLAQELGVDLKKITQYFQNCQAGNYGFAKKLREALNSGNNTDDDSRSVVSVSDAGGVAPPRTQQPLRMDYSSSPAPAPAPTPQRGRPPGSKKSALAVVINSANGAKPSHTPAKRGRPRNIASSISDGPIPVKKRGRPFATAEAAIKAAEKAARRAAGEPEPRKRTGRPAKVRGQPYIEVPEPTFYPFICEWANCPAELQNLETLRAHIKMVHRKRNEENLLECQWKGCYEETKIENAEVEKFEAPRKAVKPKSVVRGCEFKDKHVWAQHIEDRHVMPIARLMGDGPQGTDLSLEKPPAIPHWLKNPLTGEVVTPSVANQALEGGRPKKNNKKRFQAQGEGPQVVLVPIADPDAYTKVAVEDEGNEPSSESTESTDTDEDDETSGDVMDVDEVASSGGPMIVRMD